MAPPPRTAAFRFHQWVVFRFPQFSGSSFLAASRFWPFVETLFLDPDFSLFLAFQRLFLRFSVRSRSARSRFPPFMETRERSVWGISPRRCPSGDWISSSPYPLLLTVPTIREPAPVDWLPPRFLCVVLMPVSPFVFRRLLLRPGCAGCALRFNHGSLLIGDHRMPGDDGRGMELLAFSVE